MAILPHELNPKLRDMIKGFNQNRANNATNTALAADTHPQRLTVVQHNAPPNPIPEASNAPSIVFQPLPFGNTPSVVPFRDRNVQHPQFNGLETPTEFLDTFGTHPETEASASFKAFLAQCEESADQKDLVPLEDYVVKLIEFSELKNRTDTLIEFSYGRQLAEASARTKAFLDQYENSALARMPAELSAILSDALDKLTNPAPDDQA